MINQKIYQTQYYGFEVRVYFWDWGSRKRTKHLGKRFKSQKAKVQNGQNLSWATVERSAPQGSIIGSLLFSIYGADLSDHLIT